MKSGGAGAVDGPRPAPVVAGFDDWRLSVFVGRMISGEVEDLQGSRPDNQ